MKDKVKDTLELQWIPAISTMVILGAVTITCFAWTINRIDQQSARTDRLYECFIDLLKENRNG